MRTILRTASLVGLSWLAAGCGDIELADSSETGIAIDEISPRKGPLVGGTAVTLQGSGFGGDTPVVLLDGRRVPDVEVLSDSTLVLRTPRGSERGVVDLVVFNANGYGGREDAYEYTATLVLASVTPRIGHPSGGNTVTLHGEGFDQGNLSATIDGSIAVEATVVSDTEASIVMPPGTAFETVSVELTSPAGQAAFIDAYTYLPPGLLVANGQGVLNGTIYHVDPVTALATPVSQSPGMVTGMVVTDDGMVYASYRDSNYSWHFGKLDLATGALEDITGLSSPLPDITMTPNGIMGYLKYEQRTVLIDPDTGSIRAAGHSINGQSGCGIASGPDGVFFAGNRSNGTLVRLTEEGVMVGPVLNDPAGREINGMTYHDGQLFALRKGFPMAGPGGGGGNGATLLRINPDTGEVNEVGLASPGGDALAALPISSDEE